MIPSPLSSPSTNTQKKMDFPLEGAGSGKNSRRSSWTQEDDELFEQLILELSLEESDGDELKEEGDFSKIREELFANFKRDLDQTSQVDDGAKSQEVGPPRNEDVDNLVINNTLETDEMKTENKEHVIYDSFRDWLESNRRIIDLEKDEESLFLLELFIRHKERQLLKKIVAHSDHDGTLSKKLFFKKVKRTKIYETATKRLLMLALRYILPIDSTKTLTKSTAIDSFSNESHLISGESSSDEEDNTPKKTTGILTFHNTSGQSSTVTKSYKIYPTSTYIDKYHEGMNFYEHLKDIIVGGDLQDGGAMRAVAQLKNTKDRIETFFGIDMTEESWIRFKNYIRTLVLNYRNEEITLDSGKQLTDLSESDLLKELYPFSNEKNQPNIRWKNDVGTTTHVKTNQTDRKKSFLSKMKALKLIYGSSGYVESLLSDNFVSLYLYNNGSKIFSKDTPIEQKKVAIENEIRNLELKLVNAKEKEEHQWIEFLIKYLRNTVENGLEFDSFDDLSENQWNELEDMVETMGKKLQVYNTGYKKPEVIQLPSDQYKSPKLVFKEELLPKNIPAVANADKNIKGSWKTILNSNNLESNKYSAKELNNIRTKIEEKGFSLDEKNDNEEISARHIEKISFNDTEWNSLDTFTTLPFLKTNPLFNAKTNPFPSVSKTYQQFRNGLFRIANGFKFYGVSPSDSSSFDWEIGTKFNEDEKMELSPYAFKLKDLYAFLSTKTYLSTVYALSESRKIASLFFKEISVEKLPKDFSNKLSQWYHELVKKDSLTISQTENLLNNPPLLDYLPENKNFASFSKQNERNEQSNREISSFMEKNMQGQSTGSNFYLSNTFRIDENVWNENDLINISKGVDVGKEIYLFQNQALKESFVAISKVINAPTDFTYDQFILFKIDKPIIEEKHILPRVSEIQDERFDKFSFLHLEQAVVQFEGNMAHKSLSGVEPSEEEKLNLKKLKQKVESERKRLENVPYTQSITAVEQAKLERLGIFQQSLKSLSSTPTNSKEEKEQIEMEKQLIMDKEFRVLDQLLDQMNREQRREVLSYKGNDSSLIQTHQDAIKNYAKLRSYYYQIARKDSSMREWQSLTVKEKLAFEKEFKKLSKNESYENIVTGVSKIMQSAQFSETFSFISSALAKKIVDSKQHNTEFEKMLLESQEKEMKQIQNVSKEFIHKNGIDQRYKAKLLSKHRKLEPNEKNLREKYNYEDYTHSIISPNHITSLDEISQQNVIKAIIENEMTKDELYSLISHQYEIQSSFKKERLYIARKYAKNSADSILIIEERNEDPLFGVLKVSPMSYFTFGQKFYFKKIFEENMIKKLVDWREKTEYSASLCLSPHYLRDERPLKLDEDAKTDYDVLTKKVFDINSSKAPPTTPLHTNPIFPELPWDGSFKDLQLLYVRMQLERSNNPYYTRSVLEFNNTPERFLQRSFWKGVWMLPESLSNFIFTSDPHPIIKRLPPVNGGQIEKKVPPIVTPTQPPPIVTPIIPTIPIPSVQTPPPPLTQTFIPPQMPTIPRIQVPIQRSPIQPPTLPIIQPPSQPSIIPQRTPVTVSENPIYPRYLLENLNRRLFQ